MADKEFLDWVQQTEFAAGGFDLAKVDEYEKLFGDKYKNSLKDKDSKEAPEKTSNPDGKGGDVAKDDTAKDKDKKKGLDEKLKESGQDLIDKGKEAGGMKGMAMQARGLATREVGQAVSGFKELGKKVKDSFKKATPPDAAYEKFDPNAPELLKKLAEFKMSQPDFEKTPASPSKSMGSRIEELRGRGQTSQGSKPKDNSQQQQKSNMPMINRDGGR